MRIAEPYLGWVGQTEPLIQLHGVFLRRRPLFHTVMDRRLGMLIDDLMRRVERSGGRLCDIGDAGAAKRAPVRRRCRRELQAVKFDRSARDTAAIAGKAHGRKTDGRFTGPGLANKAEHLAPMKRQVDTMNDLDPFLVSIAFNAEAPDLKKNVLIIHHPFSFSPEDRNSIQSTTKLTATVKSAIAAAGIRGVMSPKEISVAFSRTIDPQSAVGG